MRAATSRIKGAKVMTRRFCLFLLAALVGALALFPAPQARAQGPHIEFSPYLDAVGEVVLSFDLPADYTVTDQSRWMASAQGPLALYSAGPRPARLFMLSGDSWSAGTPKEAAYDIVAQKVGDRAGPILAEGPLTVGEFEGYTVRVRQYVTPGEDGSYTTVLVIVVRLASEDDPLRYPPPEPGGNGYVSLSAEGWEIEHFEFSELEYAEDVFLESGESLPQWYQRGFDAILGSLTVSLPPLEEPTPEPTLTPTPTPIPDVTPTPTATPVPAEGERVELGPIEEGGKKYTFSFQLPEGYSVVEWTPTKLTAEGPLIDGDEPRPDELHIITRALSSKGTLAEAARQWAERPCGEDLRAEIVAEGSVSLGETDGYWVYWACMQDTTTGPVPQFRHRDILIAAGGGRFVGLTTYYSTGEFWWTEPTPGERIVTGVVEIGGRPAEEVRRADLDAILASLRVPIEDLGAPQTEFVGSVPAPDEISTDPEVIGSNIFLALFIILAFAFTSTLFNQTLDENRREIEGWLGRFFAPFRRLTSLVEQRYGAVAQRQPWAQRVVGPAVILVLTGLIYGFLSPDFGFNTKSVVLFVSVIVGVGAITYVYEGGQALFTTRRLRLGAGVKLYAVALAIAAGCVLLSRLVDFQPGFLYGFVAAYTLLAPATLDRRQSGQIDFVPAIALLAVSLIAWLLVIPLREVTQGSDAWWVALPEGAAVAVFVVGLEGLFFNMIPLSFMDGAKIAEWNRLLWFLMFGAAGFLFCWVLLNQEDAYAGALAEKRVVMALSLLAFYSIVTLATWAYFRGRVYGWAVPSISTVRGTVGGWARRAIERVPRIRWRRGPR